MNAIEREIEKYQEQARELSDVREDVLGERIDITVTAVGVLLEKLDESVNDLLEAVVSKQHYDPKFLSGMKEIIAEAMSGLTKLQPPQITVAVDLKPMVDEVRRQNAAILKVMEQISINGKNDGSGAETVRIITAMVDKNNAFLEKGMRQIDYSSVLGKISEGVNKTAEAEARIEKLTVKRGNNNLISEVVPVYKK